MQDARLQTDENWAKIENQKQTELVFWSTLETFEGKLQTQTAKLDLSSVELELVGDITCSATRSTSREVLPQGAAYISSSQIILNLINNLKTSKTVQL